jgi:hypothetical protein
MSTASVVVTGVRTGRATVLGGAIVLTLTQVAFVSLGAGDYRGLQQWDANWYAHLAERGYPDELPRERERMAEVGFFPGYPLAVRLVARTTGLPVGTATLLTAQLAACGVWAYVLLFLRRGRVPAPLALAAIIVLMAHPAAFFLMAGYSESMFLCAALGFLYWSNVRGPAGWWLAGLHGIVMTGTRIVGLPVAACPLLMALVMLSWRDVIRTALLAGVASVGGMGFFAFCQWQYGRWDAYLYAQVAGWQVTPDYLALFKLYAYRPALALLHPDGTINGDALSRWAVPVTMLLFGLVLLSELRWGRNTTAERRPDRVGLILAATVMFYIAVSGTAGSGFVGLVRYSYCAQVGLGLAAAELLAHAPVLRKRARRALPLILALAALLMMVQLMLVRSFTQGEWVA